MIRIERLQGERLQARIDDLAHLRITVFRGFPYLYDGDMAYEAQYLQTYLDSPDSVLFAVFDDDKVVGASTAIPLVDEADYVREPFVKAKLNLSQIFYFGESVLLPEYRGQGIGVRFFELREAAAVQYGSQFAYFCAVIRPDDHPLKPVGYRPLHAFWQKRGFAPVSALVSTFSWKDIDETEESPKHLSYWRKSLVATAQ